MEIDEERLLQSFRKFENFIETDDIDGNNILRLWKSKKKFSIQQCIDFLCVKLIDPATTDKIREFFPELIYFLVTKTYSSDQEVQADFKGHQFGCIALSKLVNFSPEIEKFALKYFIRMPSPFDDDGTVDSKQIKLTNSVNKIPSPLDIVKCCYNFLRSNPIYYRNVWNWSTFTENYSNKIDLCLNGQFYFNSILALLTHMSDDQLNDLNRNIPIDTVIENRLNDIFVESKINNVSSIETGPKSICNISNKNVTNVEGVILPIFNVENFNEYSQTPPNTNREKIIRVDSTKINLRSLAIGISSGKAICLSGPVGCGKTTLVEYLASITGRIPVNINSSDFENPDDIEDLLREENESNDSVRNQQNGTDLKRKIQVGRELKQSIKSDDDYSKRNGFLRIQLGDQTDGKMLLGQYRCTDVPGEFVWQPGVLTQAVMNGSWLLLEDLDSATQDVCTILSNLLENNYLTVPGFRDCLRIAPGFQLFITLRIQKQYNHSAQSIFHLIEKYLYIINMMPLNRAELCSIISENYPKLSTIADRIVDVFLTFSSGCHDIQGFEASTNFTDMKLNQNVTGTNRLVSTRDLFKLCKRSYPSFVITSAECAYFVFQNAVDLLCAYLPQGPLKTELITSIGAKLGIIPSRCVHLSEKYKPEVEKKRDLIKIGRVQLESRSFDPELNNKKRPLDDDLNSNEAKKIKIDGGGSLSSGQNLKSRIPPTFSFTRLAACILERIAVSVEQNEPILLVGETGVGKTSSVQYLAHSTNHKLIVVNMNNQSDVSDLIGGFKPVDLAVILSPIRQEFEYLFKLTYSAARNEKLLTHISMIWNLGNFGLLIKLMLKITENVFSKKLDNERNFVSNVLNRWTILQIKLLKLNSQLSKSINISFAFITGALVNCIRNGDWVLLDEINLASSETLECLSTILEPDGSIVLLEKGDFQPIKRHPDFRIFACMNPNTDIGKKDLPVGIRNRFTEFFVDELTTENDLIVLVDDYLRGTGISKSKVLRIVQLYRKLRTLAQIELNDGLGNRPVYSLRTLCRSLTICTKNLCGSVDRNLYESFSLSFLTQLDPSSHRFVLQLIQSTLLSNTKLVLSQQIPKPLIGEQINFEGYWIEKGPNEILDCEQYILTESVKENLKDLARIISIGKLPILLQGPTSAGKTSLIEYVAKKSGNCCFRINNHEHTDLQEYIGTYTADTNGKLSFKEGVLVQAMRNGYWIILDELNLAPSDILEALNRVLDDNRELFIPETQTLVRSHKNFMLFATQNPPGLYGGRKTLSRAFKNRFIELHFNEIPKSELEVILEKRCLIPKSYAVKMVKTMSELQVNRKSTAKGSFTLRDLFRWGNRYTFADPNLLTDQLYDWNQHLVDEGYLVLSSKIRNDFEVEIIAETLFKYFRKKIVPNNLFSLHDDTSMATRSILTVIMMNRDAWNGIIWTENLRRMAVLTGKGLQFNEPVLLVGPTGCGKTTICQLLSDATNRPLRILNCHMHTEGADFLGGLRPYRGNSTDQLFEWYNGPLILSMQEGGYFLADEISLAEDSVLERLNCVLEPERSILLAEKAGLNTTDPMAGEFVIKASEEFKFLATMNPGGDFGKKELSPALRNRFTEIWCNPIDSRDDLIKITAHSLSRGYKSTYIDLYPESMTIDAAESIIESIILLRSTVEKLNFSIRDILSWIEFMTTNLSLSIPDGLMYGIHLIFLDSLEMLPYETAEEIDKIKQSVISSLISDIHSKFDKEYKWNSDRDLEIVYKTETNEFGIEPFYIKNNSDRDHPPTDFIFNAPTTKINLYRLLSTLTLKKSILLEGPPGVGKTSLIENLALATGYNLVRINLCEHTDLSDLFGTDLPEKSDDSNKKSVGSFVWHDGPLLAALKSPNSWILLDELNLAPQSVLEGLNAILDHRGEVFIPELNRTFKLADQTKIFACQNPLRQGGGRKGLPQSFLNRFTKVYLKKLHRDDLLFVINRIYGTDFDKLNCTPRSSNLLEKMVEFSQTLDTAIENHEFGLRGGPFEVNLRDILRWCDLINNDRFEHLDCLNGDEFLLELFEKMKLVYYERMRSDVDKELIRNIFQRIFNCDVERLESTSNSIGLFWTDKTIYLNNTKYDRCDNELDDGDKINLDDKKSNPILLDCQRGTIKNLIECVMMKKPVIICGPTDVGKTKSVNMLSTILNKFCDVDTIDDSVMGSFQQIDLNRHLEEVSREVLSICYSELQQMLLHRTRNSDIDNRINLLLDAMFKYNQLTHNNFGSSTQPALSDELILFKNRLNCLEKIIHLLNIPSPDRLHCSLNDLYRLIEGSNTLNTGGHFEWVDSKVIKSIKHGHFIVLEHVNLCSAAILDRLNPIFEPNGTLLLSEKGVNQNDKTEIVRKHKNFRTFLTMDPKNGEISRAMRNRCIELYIDRHKYTEDDLKKLIYVNGVKEMYMIEGLIAIHTKLCDLSEFNSFTVSHIIKSAFLITEYLKMGYNDRLAILTATLEVYVRSSNVDLLGFGLKYYRDKLEQEIKSIVDGLKPYDNVFIYDNIILKSNQLNTFAMIRLQSEPFVTAVKAVINGSPNISEIFCRLFSRFKNDTVLEIDIEQIKFMLYFLYEICSVNEFIERKIYIRNVLKDLQVQCTTSTISEILMSLLRLNEELADGFKSLIDLCNPHKELPWNSKLFYRINDYFTIRAPLQISAALIANVLIDSVQIQNMIDLPDTDVITYSKHLLDGNAPYKCDLIDGLYKFLTTCKGHMMEFLKHYPVNDNYYVNLLCSLMWFNRLNTLSKQKLLPKKRIDEGLLNNIALHLKWMKKHFLTTIIRINPNNATYTYITKSVDIIRDDFLTISKCFVKNHINYLPFYEQEQIDMHLYAAWYNENSTIISHFGELNLSSFNKRIHFVHATKRHRSLIVNRLKNPSLNLNWLLDDDVGQFLSETYGKDEYVRLATKLQINGCEYNEPDVEVFKEMKTTLDTLTNDPEISSVTSTERFKNTLMMLPIYEYFALKSLNLAYIGNCTDYDYNINYFNEILTIGLNELIIVNLIESPIYTYFENTLYSDDYQSSDTISSDLVKNVTTFVRTLTATLQQFAISTICCNESVAEEQSIRNSLIFACNGPLLTNGVHNILFDQFGEFISCGMGMYHERSDMLRTAKHLLANNIKLNRDIFSFELVHIEAANRYMDQLKYQMSQIDISNSSNDELSNGFYRMASLWLEHPITGQQNNTHDTYFMASLTYAMGGSIDIHLSTYMPLIDPFEKNRLKNIYIDEDLKLLDRLKNTYKCMQVTMNYDHLGKDIVTMINQKELKLIERKKKYCRKVAIRLESNQYNDLRTDIYNFLRTCCNPNSLVDLITSAKDIYYNDLCKTLQIDEIVKRIEFWINNAEQFLQFTLRKYSCYYSDFTSPIQNAVTTLKFGLVGMKFSLIRKRDFLSYFKEGNVEVMQQAMLNLIDFPNVKDVNLLKLKSEDPLTMVINLLDDRDNYFYMLIKSNFYEINNGISINTIIDRETFERFNGILVLFNQVWQKQEEMRKQKEVEDQSLYVTRTRCENEDEEAEIDRDIQTIFPNFVQEDFGDFEQVNSLNENKKKSLESKANNAMKILDIMTEDDIKFICSTFINTMNKFPHPGSYSTPVEGVTDQNFDYFAMYHLRTKVFLKIYQKFRTCLNSETDEKFYSGLQYLIEMCRQKFGMTESICGKDGSYNYYKDSNITEAIQCLELFNKIEQRVLIQLVEWPDHAVLNDILRIITRIKSISIQSPIARFNIGVQLLRKNISDWNSVAHKNNHMKDLEIEVAEYVQKWTRLELQCWRECLQQSLDKVRSKAYRFWFFVYNLIHEYVSDNKTEELNDVVQILKQFIESSNYGDFKVRMEILKAFERYLNHLLVVMQSDKSKKINTLIRILYNLHLYYNQFSMEIEDAVKSMRVPIEKKLKEIVKIESYNKDLSYFSMRNNVARVHRNLHKFFKEYETKLSDKISNILTMKPEQIDADFKDNSDKIVNLRHETKIKYYMVKVNGFLWSEVQQGSCKIPDHIDLSNLMLLPKLRTYFLTSRNIVKQAILHSQFPNLIYRLDVLLTEQLDSCDQLRKMEVDRSQSKDKQKMQAKHILTYKRKALSDLFKMLQKIGLRYRAGLLKHSTTDELIDLKIKPFSIKTMVLNEHHKKIDSFLIGLNENLDTYYVKSVFKIKLLQTILLTPNGELGLQNLERLKGFAVDMFSLVQNQRKQLSQSIYNLNKLKIKIKQLSDLKHCTEQCSIGEMNFNQLINYLRSRRELLCKICEIFEQYKLSLKSFPSERDDSLSVINSLDDSNDLTDREVALNACRRILKDSKHLIEQIQHKTDVLFVELNFVQSIDEQFNRISNDIVKTSRLPSMIDINSGLNRLITVITECNEGIFKFNDRDDEIIDDDSIKNFNNQTENIIHLILISLQNIYKKYSLNNENLDSSFESNRSTTPIDLSKEQSDYEELLSDNHLKQMIYEEMKGDFIILNCKNILDKLSYVISSILSISDTKHRSDNVSKLIATIPILEQFQLFYKFYLIQQIGAHKVSAKMLSILLNVFIELGSKGFCIPPDLMQDDDGESNKNEQKEGEGFGLEDGTGENDVSDKIESEDQLEGAKKPGEHKDDEKTDDNCDEEKGIDMSEDFDSKPQDLKPKDDNSDDSDDESDKEDPDKEMGETEDGADKLDEQIWGSDKENEDESDGEMEEEDSGSNNKNEKESHNDLDANDESKGDKKQQDDGLDATDEQEENKKTHKEDIDQLDEPDVGEDQVNTCHNELEEPPVPEDIDLGEQLNLDGDEANDKEENLDENPFDIDKMKDQIITEEEPVDNDEEGDNDKEEDHGEQSDSEDEPEAGLKPDETVNEQPNEDIQNDDVPEVNPGIDEETEANNDEDQQRNETSDEFKPSKDKPSTEKNVQTIPDDQNHGSDDKVNVDESEKKEKKQEKTDIQDTGEDKEGTGQAENEESKTGHQGIAETKDTRSNERDNNKKEAEQQKKKQGHINEDRTVDDSKRNTNKQLKTIDKLNEKNEQENSVPNADEEEMEVDEYQHVKEARQTDKTTLDNATEDQSKKVQHNEEEKIEVDEPESTDELNDSQENTEDQENDEIETIVSETVDKKSEKPSKSDKNQEKCETTEPIDVEGEKVTTQSAQRGNETTAHCSSDLLNDLLTVSELTATETLQMKKLYEKELQNVQFHRPKLSDFEIWQLISNKMLPSARELCEQLRLILEPTKCTRLKGDYRTGRRINMRKIIPYIASQFRKDKIWLRRTKPAQRNYRITIAIDDSKSMDHNKSKSLTLEAISLVSQALILLESGRLSIVSFGESPQILLKHSDQFDGPKLVGSLNFAQNKSRIGELLDFVRIGTGEEGYGNDNGLFENLLLVLSDGRNIFSEGEQKVRNAVKLCRLQRIFIVYIIIDNPENKHSILDIRVPTLIAGQPVVMKSYLDTFPFPYYVIVRDLSQLPLVLSDAMRQWFELVNSEQ